MTTIAAVVRNGRIEPVQPLDLPRGTVLQITVRGEAGNDSVPETADAIQRALAAMDRMHPLQMTDAELATWEADRRARREREKGHFHDHAEKLRGMWV